MIADLGMAMGLGPYGWWAQAWEAMVQSLAWAYAKQSEAGLDAVSGASARDVLFIAHPPQTKKKGNVNLLGALGVSD